jgi:hypothetical protein
MTPLWRTAVFVAAGAVAGAFGALFLIADHVKTEAVMTFLIRDDIAQAIMWRGAILGAALAILWKTR